MITCIPYVSPFSCSIHTSSTCVNVFGPEFSHGMQRNMQFEGMIRTDRTEMIEQFLLKCDVLDSGQKRAMSAFLCKCLHVLSHFRAPSQQTSSWFWFWGPPPSCSVQSLTSSSSSTRMTSRWRCRYVQSFSNTVQLPFFLSFLSSVQLIKERTFQ